MQAGFSDNGILLYIYMKWKWFPRGGFWWRVGKVEIFVLSMLLSHGERFICLCSSSLSQWPINNHWTTLSLDDLKTWSSSFCLIPSEKPEMTCLWVSNFFGPYHLRRTGFWGFIFKISWVPYHHIVYCNLYFIHSEISLDIFTQT